MYYAECTTIRLTPQLSQETLAIISYAHKGSLFFNYDLLGYAFMALSTFLISFNINPKDKSSKLFKNMLMIHGVFFFSCFFVPMFSVFTSSTGGHIGTILFEIWCAYFISVCVLGYKYFNNNK